MKKLVVLVFVIVAAFAAWKWLDTGGADDPVAELQQRLDAAERSFMQASRSSGMTGIDTSADAESARLEVGRVETALRESKRTAKSEEEKRRIERLLNRAADLKRKMD